MPDNYFYLIAFAIVLLIVLKTFRRKKFNTTLSKRIEELVNKCQDIPVNEIAQKIALQPEYNYIPVDVAKQYILKISMGMPTTVLDKMYDR